MFRVKIFLIFYAIKYHLPFAFVGVNLLVVACGLCCPDNRIFTWNSCFAI